MSSIMGFFFIGKIVSKGITYKQLVLNILSPLPLEKVFILRKILEDSEVIQDFS